MCEAADHLMKMETATVQRIEVDLRSWSGGSIATSRVYNPATEYAPDMVNFAARLHRRRLAGHLASEMSADGRWIST